MTKPFFKRKIGGDGGWGVGLDYLLKEYWDKLDQLIEDNYYGRHNAKLINYLFPLVKKALQKSILEMKPFFQDKELFQDWVKKVRQTGRLGESAKKLSEKMIFIDGVTQFLRETSTTGGVLMPNQERKFKKPTLQKSEFKGVSASGASLKKIEGIVKIILLPKDFRKIKKREILVTDETDSTFLPLMKLAKAIITDEGGILCHAAIVARELKKPCVVGAKIATRVLKDGDLVEVDAEKGVIKILRRY